MQQFRDAKNLTTIRLNGKCEDANGFGQAIGSDQTYEQYQFTIKIKSPDQVELLNRQKKELLDFVRDRGQVVKSSENESGMRVSETWCLFAKELLFPVVAVESVFDQTCGMWVVRSFAWRGLSLNTMPDTSSPLWADAMFAAYG